MVILEPCEIETLGADAVIKLVALMKSPMMKTLSSDVSPVHPDVDAVKKPEKTPRQKELILRARDIITHDEAKKKILMERITAHGKDKITQLSAEELEEVMKDV